MWRSVFMLKRLNSSSSTLIPPQRTSLYFLLLGILGSAHSHTSYHCSISDIFHIHFMNDLELIYSCVCNITVVSTHPSTLSFMIHNAFNIINHMEPCLNPHLLWGWQVSLPILCARWATPVGACNFVSCVPQVIIGDYCYVGWLTTSPAYAHHFLSVLCSPGFSPILLLLVFRNYIFHHSSLVAIWGISMF